MYSLDDLRYAYICVGHFDSSIRRRGFNALKLSRWTLINSSERLVICRFKARIPRRIGGGVFFVVVMEIDAFSNSVLSHALQQLWSSFENHEDYSLVI